MDRREFLKKLLGSIILGGAGSLISKFGKPIVAEAKGEGVVLFPERRCLVHMNETGIFVFKKLQQGYSPEQIAKMISEEYDVDEKRALKDIEEFIISMKEKGILDEEAL